MIGPNRARKQPMKSSKCVYCVTADATTSDHVIARGFFPREKRHGIPQVPACAACNGLKAKLEHYATAVIPFGGTNPSASAVLNTLVQSRLEKNLKLARELEAGKKFTGTEMTLPIDPDALSSLFQMMTRGLAYAEFGVLLPDTDCVVHADFLTAEGRRFIDALHAHNGKRTGVKTLGDGIFMYDGVQSSEVPELTVWRMSLCGVVLGGDPKAPNERVTVVHALTAPRRISAASKLVELIRGRAA
jgi:hypothetical protein